MISCANIFVSAITNTENSPKVGNALVLETYIFYLFLTDLNLVTHKQDSSLRNELFGYLFDRLVLDYGTLVNINNLPEVINVRVAQYGEAIRERGLISKTGFGGSINWLVNNIMVSQNKDDLMVKPPVYGGFIENVTVNILASSAYVYNPYESCLIKVFKGNECFTSLDSDEIIKRIDNGVKEFNEKTR